MDKLLIAKKFYMYYYYMHLFQRIIKLYSTSFFKYYNKEFELKKLKLNLNYLIFIKEVFIRKFSSLYCII